MNRKIKNLLIILAIIIVGGLSFFTMKSAKNSISNNSNMMMGQGASSEMGTPPSKPDGDNNTSSQDQTNGQNGQMGTPPSKPDGDNNTSSQDQANGQNGQMGTPPSKPEGDNNTSSQDQTNGQNGQMGTPPSKPDGDDNSSDNMPEAPNVQMQGDMQNEQNTKISAGYYVAFTAEALVISILIVYLIMSNFSKKTIKETFNKGGKIAVYTIIVIVLTAGLTFSQIYVTNNVLQASTNGQAPNDNNMQGPGGEMNSNSNVTYTATKEITEDTTLNSGEFTSTTADENGLLVNGDVDATLSNITVDKSGDSDGRRY